MRSQWEARHGMRPQKPGSRLAERSKKRTQAVIVQDVLLDRPRRRRGEGNNGADSSRNYYASDPDDDDDECDASEALFELANAPEIGYRVAVRKRDSQRDEEEEDEEGAVIYIHQDVSACGRHTGGIVWETCFLLLEYLSMGGGGDNDGPPNFLGHALEVGAGCGLLGQVLAARNQCASVLLTETADVMPNLEANVARNAAVLTNTSGGGASLQCCRLDWEESEERQRRHHPALRSTRFDTVLGTDVIFAPHLVVPLLDTLRRFSHRHTRVYLCVQVRCPTSHQMFLEQAPIRGFSLRDLTSELRLHPTCAWGAELECHLLLLTRSDG